MIPISNTLFVSDLDGTLLGSNSKLSPTTVAMLNEALEGGVMFSIATARTPSTVDAIMSSVNTRLPYIVMTGSAMWHPSTGRYSDVIHMEPDTAQKVMEQFKNHDLPTFIYTLSQEVIDIYHYRNLTNCEKVFISQRDDMRYKRFHIPEDGTSILPNPLENVVLFYSMQPSKRTEATYRDILEIEGTNPIYYHDNYGPDMGILEVFSSAASKANALRKLKEKTGAECVVVFGDNINDIPMMREADVAVAVDNAVQDVKEIADIIIGANTTDSVARFILDSLKTGEICHHS